MIGGGIVGNSLTGWLAELGWTDVVQVDKGPFPNPGGSTGHASNFIFPVDHSKEMTQLTLESMRQYRDTGTLHECGGIEVARTEERLEELRRRMASAKAWGVEGCLVGLEGDYACELGHLVLLRRCRPDPIAMNCQSVAVPEHYGASYFGERESA